MRPRSLARFLAVPVVAAGIAAAVAIAAPVANAQTTDSNFDTGGTVSVTVPLSYVVQLAKAGVFELPVPASEISVSGPNETATVTFTVTGGNADVSVFRGALDLSGSFDIVSASGRFVALGNLQLDVADAQIDGTPSGSSTPVVLFDLGTIGFTFTPVSGDPNGSSDTYNAASVTVDADGASYLDSALHTQAFQAGQAVGSLAASWSIEYPND
jgi:hypothetical protein